MKDDTTAMLALLAAAFITFVFLAMGRDGAAILALPLRIFQ